MIVSLLAPTVHVRGVGDVSMMGLVVSIVTGSVVVDDVVAGTCATDIVDVAPPDATSGIVSGPICPVVTSE